MDIRRPSGRAPLWPLASTLLAGVLVLTLAAGHHPFTSRAHADDGSPDVADRARVAAWRSDLVFLVEQIREIHPDPFTRVDEADFDAQVQRIERRIPELEDHQVVVELAALLALLRDGHTGLWHGSAEGFDQQYPVVIYPFDDGLYLSGAAQDYAEFVGGEVLRVGSLDADEALVRARRVINGENDFTILDRIPRVLANPLALHALGVSEHRDRLALTVALPGGREETFSVSAVPDLEFTAVGPEVVSEATVSARRAATAPRHLRQPRETFWFEHLPDDDLVYVQFNQVRDGQHETFADFCERLFEFLDGNDVGTLVLDLRFNHGGNNQLLQPLIHGLIRRDETVNRPGHFFTVIGRGTFSAAVSCVSWLEEHTQVRFVGEPAGSAPNHFGDAREFRLPHSGIVGRISAWRWQTRLPWDDRAWFAPHIPAPPTFEAYVEGRDPALEAILRARGMPSLSQALLHAFEQNGVDAIESAYRDYKEGTPDRWLTTEAETNALGYRFLGEGKLEAALAVFQLNVESYPNSANTYDSLAEAHLESGNYDKAVKLYEKALEVDPDFESAARMLERLRKARSHGDAEAPSGEHP